MSRHAGTGNAKRPHAKADPGQPSVYQIRIEGHLDDQWADWFSGLIIRLEENGYTLLSGPVVDQAALFGLLRKVRDLGMPLVSLNRLEPRKPDIPLTASEKEKQEVITSADPTKKMDAKALLSTLWIVVMINMLTADILSLYIPGALDVLAKSVGETPIAQRMLAGAVVMEISIVMIILSRVLKYGVNRWLNIIASILTIVFIVAGKAPYPHYTFIAAVEVICLLLIIWNAWRWSGSEG